jgi:ComF family protein
MTRAFLPAAMTPLRQAAGLVIDTLLPPQCLLCQSASVDRPGRLCPACWGRIAFLDGAGCARCGLPLPQPLGPSALCAACAARPPLYDRARAAFRYDAVSRVLVTRFKYADRLEAAASFAAWMARAGAPLLAETDALVPVPLHRLRLFTRRYNQAAVLARQIGRQSGVAVWPDLLVRRRATSPQVGLSGAARQSNVRHAFGLRPARAARLAGARIVLVDDVLTTGATVEACARVLREGGAAAVDVLCLARVVAPGAAPI